MLDQFIQSSNLRNRIRNNVLNIALQELLIYLHERGYSPNTLQRYMEIAEHFGRWVEAKNIPVNTIENGMIEVFLQKHLLQCQCPNSGDKTMKMNRAGLKHLLHILKAKQIKNSISTQNISPIDSDLNRFRDYLKNTCGLAETTCIQRIRYVREFLYMTFGKNRLDIRTLGPCNVRRFIAKRAKGCKAGTAQVIASALRSYLRFLQLSGYIDRRLVEAVSITPRRSRLGTIPKTMNENQIVRFLSSFNRETANGQRNYAMAVCMLDLGMRASEVAELRLEDINWREGIITITRRKTCSSGVLPLTRRCGQAIAIYLKRYRHDRDDRQLFVSHRAPLTRPVNAMIVFMSVLHTFERAGLVDELKGGGSGILRHTAAARMHQKGATIKEVADVLGHQSIDTTVIYTKVNLPMLEQVALPWMEVTS